MPKKVQSFGTADVKCKSNRPSQPVKGPGKMGKNAPMIPKIMQINPRKSKRMSIDFLLYDENTKRLLLILLKRKRIFGIQKF